MLVSLLLGLQMAASGLATGRVDLGDVVVHDRCDPTTGDEIVVCGSSRETERQRLHPLADPADALFPQARVDLGNGISAAAHTESVTYPGGIIANRAMVTLTVPF